MNILLNGRSLSLEKNNIRAMLELSGIKSPNGIAVAVNNAVIPRSQWEQFELKEQDKVIIIRATQGG